MRTRMQAAVPAVALAALAAAVAFPALESDAQSPGTRDLVLREKVRAIKFVQHKRSTRGDRLARGDRVITQQGLFNESNTQIGSLFTDCVNVGPAARVFKATLQCTATYRLRDGQVVMSGLVRLGVPGARAPIVGGSGAYRTARGEVESGASVKGYDSVDILHLTD